MLRFRSPRAFLPAPEASVCVATGKGPSDGPKGTGGAGHVVACCLKAEAWTRPMLCA